MTVFVSYSKRDAAAVRLLVDAIKAARHEYWYDTGLDGGQQWWDTILERIRTCELFVVALSPDWLRSVPCQRELEYAVATNRRILPVLLREVDMGVAPEIIKTTQYIDFQKDTKESGIQLTVGLYRSTTPTPLPDPLPDPPAVPIPDVEPLRIQVVKPSLTLDEQRDLVDQLRRRVEDRQDEAAVAGLLRELRARNDLVESVAHELDSLLARAAVALPPTDGPSAPVTPARPLGLDPRAGDLLRKLVTYLRKERCVPILGPGLTDPLLGARQQLALRWAQTFEFAMESHARDDLPNVAQFVAVMTDEATLKDSLAQYVVDELHRRYPTLPPPTSERPLEETVVGAWQQHRSSFPTEPYTVLAGLPCPVYVTTQPLELMAEALRHAGKNPKVELCRWRDGTYDWPDSVFEKKSPDDADFVPTVEEPLVFHLFGSIRYPDSLVLTEDDYFAFLASVAAKRNKLIPPLVQGAVAEGALLFLGFGLEEVDVRVLLRALFRREGRRKGDQDITHVAAQLDPGQGMLAPARAKDYLVKYFGSSTPRLEIFWGTVEQFAVGLDHVWRGGR